MSGGWCVTWRKPLPSGRIVNRFVSRKSGVSGLRKRIRLPSGDQSAPSPARRLKGVRRRSPLPSALTMKSACFTTSSPLHHLRVKTSRLPSGDHWACTSSPSNFGARVTRRTPPPDSRAV